MSVVKQGRSELGVALLLLVLGAWALIDASRLPDLVSRSPVSSKTVPVAVGILLVVTAVLLAVDILRGGRGEQEAGEDVDLSQGSDWKTLGLLVVAFVANILLIDRLGWPVSGAVLFFGTTFALGSRHLIRNAIISVALSVSTWYLFNLGLGIALPVGILKGIL
ncbi:tripartite tricarboxylate transporter TctB family protein [Streptomyces sp. SID13031]|uniref:tripartite tricarboxylate transporter TctB family protein n=1 Tax=Streptomyces sp. SID13031 TaxID=2706046 RepID=UPI0013C6A59F|nr:tripartite tricarboxylate transporter TctB family protein [Streptomyces sp. SID13031]NEA35708.1 tripartite tricarboxylate transporter TctB family protein [Streptomyces sp. SID13031]